MAELTARDIMTPDPAAVAPDAQVTEAARIMTEKGIGALVVMDGDKLVGLVTEGDLIMQDVKIEFPTYIHLLDGFIMYPPATVKFEQELKKAVAASVADVMSDEPITVQASASIEEVASLLSDRDVSRLPVLDGDKVVGIVSKHDIVRAMAQGLT